MSRFEVGQTVFPATLMFLDRASIESVRENGQVVVVTENTHVMHKGAYSVYHTNRALCDVVDIGGTTYLVFREWL